jgi:hypothetical protein
MKEAEFYKSLFPWIDEWIIGNHEAPALWPYDDRFKFYGYEPGDMGLGGYDPDCVQLVRDNVHQYKIATSVNGWLITHAGLLPRYQKAFEEFTSPENTANKLNDFWHDHMMGGLHPYHNCLICDPSQNNGGVLWNRWEYLRSGYRDTHMKQIVGHTPDPSCPQLFKTKNLWCIDTPRLVPFALKRSEAGDWGGVAALVSEDGGEWELFYEK